MSILTVQLVDGQGTLNVADNTLVYNGKAFVDPSDAFFVALYAMPIDALSLPFETLPAQTLVTQQAQLAWVLSYLATAEPTTDPSLVVQPDPANGQCVCGVTCQGTQLSYVKVTTES